jgi:Fe2+ or Zn2+ uptake regulation protein
MVPPMDMKRTTPHSLVERDSNTRIDPRAEILAYLRAHPAAADTVDGIVEWWLPRQRYETAKAAIQRALDSLVAEGVIDELVSDVGTRLYRLRGSGEDDT